MVDSSFAFVGMEMATVGQRNYFSLLTRKMRTLTAKQNCTRRAHRRLFTRIYTEVNRWGRSVIGRLSRSLARKVNTLKWVAPIVPGCFTHRRKKLLLLACGGIIWNSTVVFACLSSWRSTFQDPITDRLAKRNALHMIIKRILFAVWKEDNVHLK